ncbi:MAG: hypothetical protein JSW11_17440 [Candidatus Heimdallarchaeota archaeon]|nr:MAG: hypothetical protein JSW11_17440 [Candidatus Heimdallarchaeota archaeon]
MSEVRGQKGFEGPSEQELEDYIRQSRKSLSRMQKGKSPLIFRPKKNRTRLIIGIFFLLIIPTAFLSFASLMSNQLSNNNDNNTTTETTDTKITEPSIETTTPIPEELDPEQVTRNLEIVIEEMISPTYSTINPIIIDGSINISRLISDTEVLDLIWYFNQFKASSKWWNIGRELLFEKFPLWNNSYAGDNASELHIKLLRTFLVYRPEEIPLNTFNLENFHNSCLYLWETVLPKIDRITSTLGYSPNNSFRLAGDQILFIEFLSNAVNFPNLFNLSLLSDYARQTVETLDQLTNRTNGIPNFFDINSSEVSPIFYSKHQGNLILALNKLNNEFDIGSSVSLLISRINTFIGNHLINEDWSYSAYYNSSNRKDSDEILASDQSVIIRCKVLFERLRHGQYITGTLIEKLEAPNSGFYSSSKDQNLQYLLDQVQILLAVQELILLESIIYPSSEIPHGAATWGFGVLLIIFSISFIPLKRKLWKRKRLISE